MNVIMVSGSVRRGRDEIGILEMKAGGRAVKPNKIAPTGE
jgi:hypothetical protein